MQNDIEAVLRSHPGIADVRVHVVDGSHQVVYVVPVPLRVVSMAGQSRYMLPNGMAVLSDNQREAMSQYNEFFIEDALRCVSVCDGDVVLDIGANIGMFSLMLQAWDTHVLAFEPAPQTYNSLRFNAQAYGRTVEAFQMGIGHRDEVADFAYCPWSPSFSGYYSQTMKDEMMKAARNRAVGILDSLPGDVVEERQMLTRYLESLSTGSFEGQITSVPIKTISSIINQHGLDRVDLVKIDVEGYELHVLKGIADSDWVRIRQIVLEAHREELTNGCASILRDRGYKLEVQATPARGPGTCQIYAVQADETRRSGKRGMAQADVIQANRPLTVSELQAFMAEQGFADHITFVIVEELSDRDVMGVVVRNDENGQYTVMTETERRLMSLVSEMLDGIKVSRDDDVLERASEISHTVLLLQLATRVYTEFGVQLPIEYMFRGPYTISRIGAVIDAEKALGVSQMS